MRSEFLSTHLAIPIGIEAGEVSLSPPSLKQFRERSKLIE